MTRATSIGNNFTVTKEWVSSDESIATVDQNGTVTFKKSGIVLISFCTTFYFKNATVYFYSKRTLYVYKLEEDENVFSQDTQIPEEVRGMALEKMNEYYNDNPEIKAVVDGTDPDCNTCIFAFEGLGEGYGGNSTEHPIEHKYLCAMMVVTKSNEIVYATRKASTLPDNRPDMYTKEEYIEFFKGKPGYDSEYDATTTLKDGIYDYYSGYHKSSYAALKPYSNTGITSLPGWYLNGDEKSFHSDNCEGINIHASGQNPKKEKKLANSLGCQRCIQENTLTLAKLLDSLMKV